MNHQKLYSNARNSTGYCFIKALSKFFMTNMNEMNELLIAKNLNKSIPEQNHTIIDQK